MSSRKVVIIGGGFAGSTAARLLEEDFNVTLIDTKNYFEFTPSILRTIVEPIHLKKIQRLHTSYLGKAQIVIGEVEEVTPTFVKVGSKEIEYDYLLIASGSRYNTPIKEQDVVLATRAAHLRDYYKKLCSSMSVIIIGGGIVGVELAAEIATHYSDKKITIVHSQSRLMERNSRKASEYAHEFLRKKGVSFVFNERIIDAKGKKFVTDQKNTLEADMAFLCTGITPNYEFLTKHFKKSLNERNTLVVNAQLQLAGNTNIFAAGDISNVHVEKTAQHAQHQGTLVAENIRALEAGKALVSYTERKQPMVISLGRYKGIFERGSFVWGGYVPGLLKRVIEFKEMWKLR